MKAQYVWLTAAMVLFVAAAWLFGHDEDARASKAREEKLTKLHFPRHPRAEDVLRGRERMTLPVLAESANRAPGPIPAYVPRRDPLLVALGGEADTALVLEVSAFRNMPIGKMLFECFSKSLGFDLERFRKDAGIDPEKIERIAVLERPGQSTIAILSGDFDSARLTQSLGASSKASDYGSSGRLYDLKGRDGDVLEEQFGLWSDKMLFVGAPGELKAAMDRIDARVATPKLAVPSELAYGEMYGKMSANSLTKLLAKALPAALAEAIRRTASDVELHVDATDDALIVADVSGQDATGMEELGRTFGGALAAGRLGAKAEGDSKLAELLELARVSPRKDGSFSVETALPAETVRHWIGDCTPRPRDVPQRP